MEFEIGQTWRTRSRALVDIVLVGKSRVVVKTENGDYYSVHSSGYCLPAGMGHHGDDLREQIVASKLQLREGAWYKRENGTIKGPAKATRAGEYRPWLVGGIFYENDGTNSLSPRWHLREEVPDPTPKPVYRPFANAVEFAPHRDRRIKRKAGSIPAGGCCKLVAYDDDGVWVDSRNHKTYQEYFAEDREFEDGTPFGVRVS